MINFKQFIKENISLEYHDELNQKLFDGDKLRQDVRLKLLEFAHAWIEFANAGHEFLKADMVKDIYMTGGNVNYNYTALSDIDMHIIVNKSKVENIEAFDKLMDDAKQLWTATYGKDVHIKGYPVEPYAQDESMKLPDGQGAYSVMRDAWVVKPENKHLDFKHNKRLETEVDKYENIINRMIQNKASMDELTDLSSKLYNMRGKSIEKNGEFAFWNLVYKELRNRGVLDKLKNYKKDELDKELSLENVIMESKEYEKYFELPNIELANSIVKDLKKHGGNVRQDGNKLYFPDKMTFDYSVYHHLVKVGANQIKTIVKELK